MADSEAVKLNANAISVQANDNLYAYATEFNAPAGQIQLKAGEALGLYAVQKVDVKEVESKTTSSFAGIKYRKVNTKDSKQIISELPTSLIANYSQSGSGGNTQLQGTRFTNLQGASITAGVGDKAVADARIILGRIGQMKDGTKVIVRNRSSDGRPTLEIQSQPRKIEIRYNTD